ncbi:MAG: energy transducer TonB [Gemmatimonadota bacterium]
MALDPRDQIFRAMLALSAGFHVLLFLLFVLWTGLSQPSPRFVQVAVVDLVGGLPPEARPAAPEAAPPAPAKGQSRRAVPARPPARKARERPAKAEARAPRVAVAPPDARGLSARIRKMREDQVSEQHVREALGTLRREKEARAAVGRMRERVAHRVDLSALRPAPPGKAAPAAGGALGGAPGSSRVPPEQLAYFRELDERIRENWILPAVGRTEAGNRIVQIRITIEKDGRVTNVQMEKSSGNRYFDDSVLRAIAKASPLPVPPEQLRGTEDHYDVGFRFYESGGTR